MLALAVPVAAGWLQGIWIWPQDLYVFRPIFCVLVGGYAFMVLRNLDGVGFRLLWRKKDISDGFLNLLAFSITGHPAGNRAELHPSPSHGGVDASRWHGARAELLIPFHWDLPDRGHSGGVALSGHPAKPAGAHASTRASGLYGLLIASVVFGLSHLHHAPVPNWRYAILATLAGIFYGNVYRTRQRLCASALTHALVDTIWHFWF